VLVGGWWQGHASACVGPPAGGRSGCGGSWARIEGRVVSFCAREGHGRGVRTWVRQEFFVRGDLSGVGSKEVGGRRRHVRSGARTSGRGR